jgi:hypothetical protein
MFLDETGGVSQVSLVWFPHEEILAVVCKFDRCLNTVIGEDVVGALPVVLVGDPIHLTFDSC